MQGELGLPGPAGVDGEKVLILNKWITDLVSAMCTYRILCVQGPKGDMGERGHPGERGEKGEMGLSGPSVSPGHLQHTSQCDKLRI